MHPFVILTFTLGVIIGAGVVMCLAGIGQSVDALNDIETE